MKEGLTKNKYDIADAQIRWRNFEGLEGTMNPKGKRNFVLLLSDEMAEILSNDGYSVKVLDSKEEGYEPQPILKVQVKYHEKYPGLNPTVKMIAGDRMVDLDENTINRLDVAEILTCDLTIRPYDWVMRGEEGRTAYLDQLYVKIKTNRWEDKYSDYLNSAVQCVGDHCPIE